MTGSNGVAKTTHHLRKDIQGVRAVAVIVVILDHMLGWPHGGFVGVDIFFVISGFLITDLMLRERDRTGKVSYLGFYRRRIRRIIPASLLVLTATVTAAYLLYQPIRARIVRVDAQWALVFLSNWHFSDAKTDYFNNEGLTSPIQHFWSLAVEEQFYVVWPVVVIAVIALCRRRSRGVLAGLIGGAALVSFLYGLWDSQHSPITAYFSTPARAWELAVGAFLAVIAPRLAGMHRAIRLILVWIGLAGIAVSLAVIRPTSVFPAPWAALPVLAAACIIISGIGGTFPGPRLLTNVVSQYIGNISYSLYLWHFPVIILLSAYSPADTIWRTVMMVTMMVGCAVLSFHYVEDPVRRSTWLDPRRLKPRRVGYRGALAVGTGRRMGLMTLGIAIVSTATFVGHLGSRPAVAAQMLEPVVTGGSSGSSPKSFAQSIHAQIDAALAATQFPALKPSVNDLDDNKAPAWTTNGCGTTGAWNASKCVYGDRDAKRTVAVVGDSIALSWLPGLKKAFIAHGYVVHSFVAGSCPAARVGIGDADARRACSKHRRWAIGAIKSLKPDLIVMSDASFLLTVLSDDKTGDAAEREWQAGALDTLKQLTPVAKTVVLSSPPGSKSLVGCSTVRAQPAECVGRVSAPSVVELREAETTAAAKTGAHYIDMTKYFCAKSGACPSFVGHTPVYVDGEHLTRQYSAMLAPGLAAALGLAKTSPQPG